MYHFLSLHYISRYPSGSIRSHPSPHSLLSKGCLLLRCLHKSVLGFFLFLLPIQKKGKIVTITPSTLTWRFMQAVKVLNLPHFRYHDLRHYSASIMHAIGVPDVYIMERSGWSSDRTLKNIYRNSLDDYQKKYTELTNNYFKNL